MGGFDDLFDDQGYDVTGKNWYNGSTKTGTTITDYFTAAQNTTAGAPEAITLGQVINLGSGATLKVVAVAGELINGLATGATDENDLSVAVLLQYGSFDMMWAGDLGGGDDDTACTGRVTDQLNLETPLAQALTPGGDARHLGIDGVDVLQVNHHGSMSSTNADWMNLLRPEVAVITVGDSGFQHPRTEVVDNVLRAGAPCITAPPAVVLQTEEGDDEGANTSFTGFAVGDIIIKTDGAVSYTVKATGEVSRPPDERNDAMLPWNLLMDEVLLVDGFESGDTSAWSAVVGGGG